MGPRRKSGQRMCQKIELFPTHADEELSVREEPETDHGILCAYTAHALLMDKYAVSGLD